MFIFTEHSPKLTWTGEDLGTCKDAKFEFKYLSKISERVHYRIDPKIPKFICPKDVRIEIENASPYLHYFDCCYHGDRFKKLEDQIWEAHQGSYCKFAFSIFQL